MGSIIFLAVIVSLIFIWKTFNEDARRKKKISRIQSEIDARRAKRGDDWDNIYREGLKEYDKYPSTRKHAKPELDKFLDVKRKTRIIIFDVETNGLNSESSVLSCSAIKHEYDPASYALTELDRFNRYYYPSESFNPSAISINGLTEDVIEERRRDATYPKYFAEDADFEKFCNGVSRVVAHNISFDLQFVPFIRNKKKFCTMMTNMDIVAVKYFERKRQWKWPKLSETASYYGLSLSDSQLHGSMYDAEITSKIFSRMLEESRK